jgi:hypothetical protein
VDTILGSESLDVRKIGVKLLMFSKSSYAASDIDAMFTLIERLKEVFPSKTKVVQKTKMLSSKSVDAIECHCGHVYDVEQTYCSKCLKDQYGFEQGEASLNQVIGKLEADLELLWYAFKAE